MIEVYEESYNECVDDIHDLGARHTVEINVTRSDEPLAYKPNLAMYDALNEAGALTLICARNNGVLIGYGVLVTTPDITNIDAIVVTCNMLYVLPQYRGRTSLQLLNACEQYAKDVEADFYSVGVKPQADFSKLLLRKGYKLDETFYIKKL